MRIVPNSWGSPRLREYNQCHDAKGQFCEAGGGVPSAPGTTPVPPGMVRAYHYTNNGEAALQSILAGGLSTSFARGSTYGEPNVIWLSTQKPGDFKYYVEVLVDPSEIGIGNVQYSLQTPEGWVRAETPTQKQQVLDQFNSENHNFALAVDHLPASRIVTHSEPWMAMYHQMVTGPESQTPFYKKMVQEIAQGKHDGLLSSEAGREKYGKVIQAIKDQFGPKRTHEALREFNRCHVPAGSGKGGQFGGKDQCALDMYPGSSYSKPVPKYLHAAVLAARRAGIEVSIQEQPEPVRDVGGVVVDPLAKSHLEHGEVRFRDKGGADYVMPRGRITLVLRGGEYDPMTTDYSRSEFGQSKRKDLKPEDLKTPATRFDVISTLLHEIGHAVVKDPTQPGEYTIHPSEIIGEEKVSPSMAREVAAWQFAIAFMPKNLISPRMVTLGLASHAYAMYHEEAVRAESFFQKHVARYDQDENIRMRLNRDPFSPDLKAKADAFAAKVTDAIMQYGQRLRRTGAKLIPPSRPAPWYDLRKRLIPGPGGVGV